jgi:hypothetical protein
MAMPTKVVLFVRSSVGHPSAVVCIHWPSDAATAANQSRRNDSYANTDSKVRVI